jgi:hypothetical protein
MIYLLTRKNGIRCDEYISKIIRADTESDARQKANEHVGDEGKIWEYSELVHCEIVNPDGACEEILGSFNAG